jgi:hypothetical protein
MHQRQSGDRGKRGCSDQPIPAKYHYYFFLLSVYSGSPVQIVRALLTESQRLNDSDIRVADRSVRGIPAHPVTKAVRPILARRPVFYILKHRRK